MFFQKFREALVRLPAGLIRPGSPASPETIAAVETTLRAKLPADFVSFLESFDGAELFHESVLLAGIGVGSPRQLLALNEGGPPGLVVFAEAAGGDRFAFDRDGRVLRLRSESDPASGTQSDTDERWLAGGDFSRWLDGVVAYHRVLYGPDGEFAPDAFEPDGAEVMPLVALKQTERALRACPDSAEWHHERGVALRRLGRLADAKDAFAEAAALDPENPWPRFDQGRMALQLGPALAREAGAAFESAARVDGGDAAGRLWVWAARAAQLEASPERLALCRREALAREPALVEQLRRARDAAGAGEDPDELTEAEALLDALEAPVQPGRMRLPVVQGEHPRSAASPADPRAPSKPASLSGAPATPARRMPPPGRRRPGRAAPPRSGGRRPAPRR